MTTFNALLKSENPDDLIQNSIQVWPVEREERYNKAVDEIVRFLQTESPSFRWKVSRVVKSGSLAKGTAVSDHVDIDLVCFIERSPLQKLEHPKDFLEKRLKIVNDIADKFGNEFGWQRSNDAFRFQRCIPKRINEEGRTYIPIFDKSDDFLLKIKLVKATGKDCYSINDKETDEIEVEIVPSFDLYDYFGVEPGKRRGGKIFTHFREQPNVVEYATEFAPSLVEMQMDFFRDHLNFANNYNCKKLILMVKFWFKTVVQTQNTNLKVPSFLFELLCLWSYEKKLRNEDYDLKVWFSHVMSALMDFKKICIEYYDKYDASQVLSSLRGEQPLILDPENPFRNSANKVTENEWKVIAKCAANAKIQVEQIAV